MRILNVTSTLIVIDGCLTGDVARVGVVGRWIKEPTDVEVHSSADDDDADEVPFTGTSELLHFVASSAVLLSLLYKLLSASLVQEQNSTSKWWHLLVASEDDIGKNDAQWVGRHLGDVVAVGHSPKVVDEVGQIVATGRTQVADQLTQLKDENGHAWLSVGHLANGPVTAQADQVLLDWLWEDGRGELQAKSECYQ